jgi:hypothetical protein
MEYRLYENGDEQGVVDLLDDVFNGWPKFDLPVSPLDHWKWKYLDNPYGSIVALGCDTNKIIQCRHIIFKQIKVGNTHYKTSIAVDLALHQDYRGTGEYGRLTRFKETIEESYNLKFRTFIQSHPKLIAKDKAEGTPRFPHTVNESLRIRDPDLHFNRKNQTINKLGFKSLAAYNQAKNIIKPITSKTADNVSITKIKEFDDRVNDFWNRVKEYFKFIFVRDKQYLNWRYCDPRGGVYAVYTAEIDSIFVGYMVLRVNRIEEDYPTGYVVDILVDPSFEGALVSLLDVMVEYFDEYDVNYVKSWNVGNAVSKYLSYFGFVSKLDKINLMFDEASLVSEDYSILKSSSASQVHFTLGDQDHI